MGKMNKFTPNDTKRYAVPAVHSSAFAASHTQTTAGGGVALLCLSGFLPNGASSRDLHVLWGSEPTTHTRAGKAEMSAASYEKESENSSGHGALLPLAWVGRSPQQLPALLPFLTLPVPAGAVPALRAEQDTPFPCSIPTPATIPRCCSFQNRAALMD